MIILCSVILAIILTQINTLYPFVDITIVNQVKSNPLLSTSNNCKQFFSKDSNIYRVGSKNLIQSWSKLTLSSTYRMLDYELTPADILLTVSQISNWWGILVNGTTFSLYSKSGILLTTKTFTYNNQVFSIYLQDKQLTTFTNYMSSLAPIQIKTFVITQTKTLALTNYTIAPKFQPTNIDEGYSLKVSVSHNGQIFAFWDDSNIYLYSNHSSINGSYDMIDSLLIDGINTGNTDEITFSFDDTLMFVEQDVNYPIKIINLSNLDNISVIANISTNSIANTDSKIQKVLCADQICSAITVFGQNYLYIFETASYTLINSINFPSSGYKFDIDLNDKLYVCNQIGVQVYNFTFSCPIDTALFQKSCLSTQNCPPNCIICTNQTICVTCANDYSLNSGLCELSQNKNNTKCQMNCLNCSNNICLQCPQKYVLESGKCSPQPMSFIQELFYTQTKPLIDALSIFASNVIVLLGASPFLLLILRLVNFLNICTLYIFLDLSLPYYLENSITTIYNSINLSFSSYFGFEISVQKISHQLVTNQKALNLGVSTDFISFNYQNITIFFIALLLAKIYNQILKRLRKQKYIEYKFSINIKKVILGQFIASIISLMLPFLFLFSQGHFNLLTKINIAFSIIVISLVTIFPFAYTCLKIKNTNKSYLKELQSDEIHICLVSVTFPMLIFLQHRNYFFICNLIVLLVGLYFAWNKKKWKINSILLAFWPIIYHLCFTIIYNFKNTYLKSFCCLIILATLILGTMHEIITIIAIIIIKIFGFLKKKCKNCLNRNRIFNIPQNLKR